MAAKLNIVSNTHKKGSPDKTRGIKHIALQV